MTLLYPAQPFPPHGSDRDTPGVIDLGVRLRDSVYRREHVERAMRPAIIERLTSAIEAGNHAVALPLLVALLDTWPAAAVVDEARRRWTEGPDATAVVVLARVSELLALAGGTDRLWPVPGRAWLRRTVGNRIVTGVARRYPGDGAVSLANFFHADIVDVDVGPPPQTDHPLGPMAASLPDPPSWPSLLSRPPIRPTPAHQPHAKAIAEIIRLPATVASLQRSELDPTPFLTWDGPHPPIAITTPAAAVLSRLDGTTSPGQIAQALQAPLAPVERMIKGLAEIGACTSSTLEEPALFT